MKKLIVSMFCAFFGTAAMAQTMVPDTTGGGYYVFPNILDSAFVNENQTTSEPSVDDRAIAFYLDTLTRSLETNRRYVLPANGTRIVRVNQMIVPRDLDKFGDTLYEYRGPTVLFVSGNVGFKLVLAVSLSGQYRGVHQRFYFRQPPSTDGQAYSGMIARPIFGIVKNPDQKTLRELLIELTEPPPEKETVR